MLLRLKTIHVSPWLRSPCQYTQNEKHTLPRVSPFTLKTFKARNSSSTDSDAFTLSETISHFRSYPCYLFVNSTQLTAFITPRQGACEQQLSQIDTEWREADAPLFTGPLTFLPEPFLMPSQPTCCKRAGRNKWKIVFFLTLWPLKTVFFLFFFFWTLLLRFYAWCAKGWLLFRDKNPDYKMFFMFISLFQ